MAIAAEHLLKTRNNLEQILADNSGQPIEKVHVDAERDNWMSAQETLEYGFIDEIMANNQLKQTELVLNKSQMQIGCIRTVSSGFLCYNRKHVNNQ